MAAARPSPAEGGKGGTEPEHESARMPVATTASSMSLRALLQELTMDDARAVAVAAMDGSVVEAVVKDADADPRRLTGDLATLFKVAAYCARKLEGGELESVVLTTEHLSVLVVALTPDRYLAVVLRAGGNVARARLTIKKRRSEFVELLA